jgi:hypothetical protein
MRLLGIVLMLLLAAGNSEAARPAYKITTLYGPSSVGLAHPVDIAADAAGNVYIADYAGHQVMRIDALTRAVTAFAGNGSSSSAGDGLPATQASIGRPRALALDQDGNLFVLQDQSIRRIDASTGLISTAVHLGYTPSEYWPASLAVSRQGWVYWGNDNVVERRVLAQPTVPQPAIGRPECEYWHPVGDGGPAASACLEKVVGVDVDAGGDIFIMDRRPWGDRLRRVFAKGDTIETFAGCTIDWSIPNSCPWQEGLPGPVSAAGSYTTDSAVDGIGRAFTLSGWDEPISAPWTALLAFDYGEPGGSGVRYALTHWFPSGFSHDGGPLRARDLDVPVARVSADPGGNLYLLGGFSWGTHDNWYDIRVYKLELMPKLQIGDLDGDLRSDLILRDRVTGQLVLWRMDGATRLEEVPIDALPDSPAWEYLGMGDFDFDRFNDLVFWNPRTRELQVWLMYGARRRGAPIALADPNMAAGLTPVGVGDYNGDDWSDLLWQDEGSGNLLTSYFMGTEYRDDNVPRPRGPGSPLWQAWGSPDINGDTWTDVVFTHRTVPSLATWMMLYGDPVAGQLVDPPAPSQPGWRLAAAGDYLRGDEPYPRNHDLVWQHTDSGRIVIWYLTGNGRRVGGAMTTPDAPADPQRWVVVGPR